MSTSNSFDFSSKVRYFRTRLYSSAQPHNEITFHNENCLFQLCPSSNRDTETWSFPQRIQHSRSDLDKNYQAHTMLEMWE